MDFVSLDKFTIGLDIIFWVQYARMYEIKIIRIATRYIVIRYLLIFVSKIEVGDLVIISPIYFDFKSHKLTNNSRLQLDSLADYLKKNKDKTISIFGYTDCLGTKEYLDKKFNVLLGKNRAISTRRYLEYKGILRSRVNVIGRGAVNFVNSCFSAELCTDSEHRENRRCEFQLNDD